MKEKLSELQTMIFSLNKNNIFFLSFYFDLNVMIIDHL